MPCTHFSLHPWLHACSGNYIDEVLQAYLIKHSGNAAVKKLMSVSLVCVRCGDDKRLVMCPTEGCSEALCHTCFLADQGVGDIVPSSWPVSMQGPKPLAGAQTKVRQWQKEVTQKIQAKVKAADVKDWKCVQHGGRGQRSMSQPIKAENGVTLFLVDMTNETTVCDVDVQDHLRSAISGPPVCLLFPAFFLFVHVC